MRIELLGPLRIRDRDGGEIPVSGTRLRGLVTLLALNAGRRVPAERIGGTLWTGESPSANTIQSLVSRLRTTLGDRRLIDSGPDGYRLDLDESRVDVHAFAALAAASREAMSGKDFVNAAHWLREALALWRGEPDEVSTIDAAAAVRLATRRDEARDDLAEAELALGNARDILRELRERAAAQPFRERPQAQLLRALADTGAHTEALALFETVKTRFAEELGADPGPALAAAHLAVLRGDTRTDRPDTNLPAPLTSFIGRDADVVAVEGALSGSRLVTVTGPGGSGKTRLAVHTGHRIAATMDVRMVELAPVLDTAELAPALVAALGLHESAGAGGFTGGLGNVTDPVERVVARVRDQPMLLVVDNCEHLLDVVAQLVARLLARCPRLRVLATGREPLGLTGEVTHPLRELPYPDSDVSLDEAVKYPAVRLLAERGRAASVRFVLDEHTLPAAVEICRRLDGLPLAIELAAARLRALSPGQLAARLGERFRLLTGGDRAALPRQRTLRAVVDWSWDILDKPERELLARMSVFVGGADMESVEAVCGDGSGEAAYTLASLVDKSLVSLTGDRYRMLETIREYGAEKLVALGDSARLRHRHAEHFAGLAEQADAQLRGPEQLYWMRRLTSDHDNIVAAARRSIGDGAKQRAGRVVTAMLWFWWLRSQHVEANELATAIAAMPGELEPLQDVMTHLASSFVLFDMTGGVEEPMRVIVDAREIRDAHGLHDKHPFLRTLDLMVSLMEQDGKTMLRDANRLCRDADSWVAASAHTFRANILINFGRIAHTERLLRRSMELYRASGDRWGLAVAGAELAEIVAWRGNVDEARELLDLALRCENEFGLQPGNSQVRTRLLYFILRDADGSEKLRELKAELDSATRMGNSGMAGYLHLLTAQYLRATGDTGAARRHLRASRDAFGPNLEAIRRPDTGPPDLPALVRMVEAAFNLDEGDLARARVEVDSAIAMSARVAEGPMVAGALEVAAELERLSGEPRLAAVRLGEAELMRGIADASNPELARVVKLLRETLGDKTFDEFYEKGRAQSRIKRLAELRAPDLNESF